VKVFINAIIVHTLLNAYVFVRGWHILPGKNIYKMPYVAFFALELSIYLVGFFASEKLPLGILHPIMIMGTSWMVLIMYLAGFLLLFDFVKILGRWIKSIRQKLNLGSLTFRRFYFLFSFLIVVALMVQGSYRFWHPVVNEMDLHVEKKSELKQLRVVVVADVHAGYLINRDVVKMYVDRILEQKGDIILLVGDIIDYDLAPIEEERVDEEFRRLNAPYGVYAVTGNHEYRLNAEDKIKWLSEKAGLTVLRDEVVKIDDSFYLVGREDDKFKDRKELKELMKDVDKSYPVICMNHEPHKLGEESTEQVDLAVYGHTHNGQLFPNNFLIDFLYEVGHGYKKKENTHVYVTSGIGLSGPQYRIGTISEIAVFNLKFE